MIKKGTKVFIKGEHPESPIGGVYEVKRFIPEENLYSLKCGELRKFAAPEDIALLDEASENDIYAFRLASLMHQVTHCYLRTEFREKLVNMIKEEQEKVEKWGYLEW